MLHKKNIGVFNDTDGTAKTVNTAWTDGDWQGAANFDIVASISYAITATTQPSTLEAQVELSHDGGTTSRGPIHLINFVSGGVIDVDDAVWDLPVGDTDPHMFEAQVRAGYAWRVSFKHTGGTSVSVLAKAEVIQVSS